MIVRRLTVDDLAAWRSIRLEALRTIPAAFLTTYEEEKARPEADTLDFLSSGSIYGAFDGGDLAGVMALVPETRAALRHRAWVSSVFVRPRWRGSAAARDLFAAILVAAQKKDLAQLEIYVEASNARAIAFYTRIGFEICGRVPRAVRRDGLDFDDLHMWLNLEPQEG